ncbi:MAG: putative ribosome recycling factor [Candidatus Peregrinibacteria bacterium Gr01-1014_25]|nr:MAG: putative ribosome recycling factor [Candidatus Peregrinibacteria bacterium Gr01-1014_25]
MPDQRITQFQKEAEKILHFLHTEFSKLQTGRANAALLEHVDVDAYGQRVQLKTVAGISVQDARTIVVQPWDKSVLSAVEKALQMANLGTNPVNDGVVLRINLPPMTEERRKDLVKIVQKLTEEARISIRQARQETHDRIKEEKDEDVKRTLGSALQAEVDAINAKVDDTRKKKEEEIMKV